LPRSTAIPPNNSARPAAADAESISGAAAAFGAKESVVVVQATFRVTLQA